MLSFHNDVNIKNKYVDRVKKHQELDNIIKGTGWENGKGCAVGCTLENYDHSLYPIELGIPEWLARLEDIIFENLPNEDAKLWPIKFLESISVGVNLEPIKHKLSILRLNRLIDLQKINLEKNYGLREIINKTINAIEIVKKCHESELDKKYCDWLAAWSAAWSAARSAELATWSAAESAESAARSAAESAELAAESAAESAELAAESATWSAARSAAESAELAAESAAWSAELAARSAAWIKEAEDLIELLKNEK